MKYKMVLLKADNEQLFMETGIQPKFSDMQKLVGGYIERTLCVFTAHDAEDPSECVMLVNEDGIGMDLPYNLMASRYAGQTIVGDVLVLQNFDLE